MNICPSNYRVCYAPAVYVHKFHVTFFKIRYDALLPYNAPTPNAEPFVTSRVFSILMLQNTRARLGCCAFSRWNQLQTNNKFRSRKERNPSLQLGKLSNYATFDGIVSNFGACYMQIYRICQRRKDRTFYNISRPNFAILLILGCPF